MMFLSCLFMVASVSCGSGFFCPPGLPGGSEIDFEAASARRFGVGGEGDCAKAPMTEKVGFRLSPGASLDSTFALSENQPALLCFILKGNTNEVAELEAMEKENRAARSRGETPFLIEFEFPSEVKLVDVAHGEIAGYEPASAFTHYRVVPHPDYWLGLWKILGDYNWWRRPGFLVKTAAKAETRFPEAKGWVSWKGKRVSNVSKITFTVIPEIPRIVRPRRFHMGCEFGGHYITSLSGAGLREWTEFAVGCGLDALQPSMIGDKAERERNVRTMREAGVRVVSPTPHATLYNGYCVGDKKTRPASDRFVTCPEAVKGLSPDHIRYIESGTCPSAIYERREFFRTTFVPQIANEFAAYDGIWCNWEPYMHSGRGCFCDTCRAKFAAFAKLSEDEMKGWPAAMTYGGKHHQTFIRFQSVEHGKMMRVLGEEVRKACRPGALTGLIPGVAWCTMCSTRRTNNYEPGIAPIDYAGDFEWISPWGPYSIWMSQKPYVYSKWRNLRTFVAAKDVRAQVNADYPAGKRPKLMGYPHGYQGNDWLIRPEAFEMNLDSFFFNGWEAVAAYHFPKGYDQRWWAAFARSAAKAAKYEDFVFDGTRIDSRVVLKLTAKFAKPNSDQGRHTHDMPIRLPMLQHVAYEKDGRIIVAAFNFWEKAPAFFRVEINGKDMGEFYCGALRTQVWEFGPGVKRVFTDADVAQWRRMLESAIERACAEDSRFEESKK